VVLGPLVVISVFVWFVLVFARNQERRAVAPLVMSLVRFVGRSSFRVCIPLLHLVLCLLDVLSRRRRIYKVTSDVTAKIEVPRKDAMRVTGVIELRANGDYRIVSGERGYALGF